ncbi:hypothetical protein DPM35_26145 [Mesorhizobium atlanticum]|uniref:Transposase DDE domain-containing protein n=1 Tax=Mesorhizobium atlanticum TaxID=2233532 RepID=A0A330GJN2_9HYPH|nr:hypothetical protein DPM35_26145 [Mesorhizobium atlanticum]
MSHPPRATIRRRRYAFPAVGRKKITAAFEGGRIASDGGVILLAGVERRLRLADRLAAAIHDPRHPQQVTHAIADILRGRSRRPPKALEGQATGTGQARPFTR